ncbi:UNVERIFIED_CONTAM: 26S proteasome non-ATPase regulatory subunit 5 [Siphonaria sp. JEL0065]|nr:26S proteasome non-ATPase regulatory subunit 5 [Siphonaria sp. JEL0065]
MTTSEKENQSLETSLTGLWVDLTQLSASSPSPADAAQAMLRYLSAKQLSVTDFIGIIVSGQSEEAVDLACKSIAVICKVLGLENMSESGLISDGLTHPEARVRGLVLDLLATPSTSNELRLQHLSQIIDTLATPSTQISKSATSLLLTIALTNPHAFYTQETVSQFTYYLQQGQQTSPTSSLQQTTSLRVSDLLIQIASRGGDAAFTETENTGLLDILIREPLDNTRDVMTRLNAIEILTGLLLTSNHGKTNDVDNVDDDTHTTIGFHFLEKSGVLSRMSGFINPPTNPEEDVEARLLQSAAIAFYARLSVVMNNVLSILEGAYGFAGVISGILEDEWKETRKVSGDIRDACLIAAGNVGGSRDGLVLLDTRFPQMLSILADSVTLGGNVKVVATQSLSCVFENDGHQDDVDVSRICLGLFDRIGGFGAVLNMVKSYDENLRVAGYACLKGVSKFPWGLSALKESGQFLNFVLDRATESSQLGMKWRYSVVESIAKNSKSKELLQQVVYDRFVKYAKEGPYYVESRPQVAMSSM